MFCPDCGTWNRTRAVKCTRCHDNLPEVSAAPLEQPDSELTNLRKASGARYRVVRRMGSGGMAHVYDAMHATLDRPLVVKVLHAEVVLRHTASKGHAVTAHAGAGEDWSHHAPQRVLQLCLPRGGKVQQCLLPFRATGNRGIHPMRLVSRCKC